MTDILVNGKPTTAEQYREDRGLSKDQYRDLVFDVQSYGDHEVSNGDRVTKAA